VQRRNFLLLSSFFLLDGCKVEYSPYSATTDQKNLNAHNIKLLNKKSSTQTESFKVAFVSDTHTYYDNFLDITKAIASREDIDFVIHCGDITDSGILQEYKWGEEILRKVDLPYVVVFGNHDALANGRRIYADMFGEENFTFSYNQAHLISFNTNNWEDHSNVIDYEWLETTLQAMPLGAIKIVAAHVPPDDSKRFTPQQIELFHTLMIQYNVSTVIFGHNHNHASFTKDSVQYITIGAASKSLYVTLDIDSTSVTMEKIDV
jgi:putative phosphoesterase